MTYNNIIIYDMRKPRLPATVNRSREEVCDSLLGLRLRWCIGSHSTEKLKLLRYRYLVLQCSVATLTSSNNKQNRQ
jgi:hypothetical protein